MCLVLGQMLAGTCTLKTSPSRDITLDLPRRELSLMRDLIRRSTPRISRVLCRYCRGLGLLLRQHTPETLRLGRRSGPSATTSLEIQMRQPLSISPVELAGFLTSMGLPAINRSIPLQRLLSRG